MTAERVLSITARTASHTAAAVAAHPVAVPKPRRAARRSVSPTVAASDASSFLLVVLFCVLCVANFLRCIWRPIRALSRQKPSALFWLACFATCGAAHGHLVPNVTVSAPAITCVTEKVATSGGGHTYCRPYQAVSSGRCSNSTTVYMPYGLEGDGPRREGCLNKKKVRALLLSNHMASHAPAGADRGAKEGQEQQGEKGVTGGGEGGEGKSSASCQSVAGSASCGGSYCSCCADCCTSSCTSSRTISRTSSGICRYCGVGRGTRQQRRLQRRQ